LEYLKIIESYFAGKLVKEELSDFLTGLDNNLCLKKEFEEYKKLREFEGLDESKISDDLQVMKDFQFDPEIYSDVLKYGGPLRKGEEDIKFPNGKQKKKSSKRDRDVI
jgi:hypothetical protein